MVSYFRFFLLAFLCSCTLGESHPTWGFADFYQVQGVGHGFPLDSANYQLVDYTRKDLSPCQVSFEITSVNRKEAN